MEAADTIEFHTANTAATHLGRKLYTSSPSALAELVANSYDAYADNVWLQLESGGDSIIVADDGVGMSRDVVSRQYATIGNPKEPTETPEGKTQRPAMGKKGIGKLASFSLGNSYTVYTKDSESPKWLSFTLCYSDMVKKENATSYAAPVTYLDELPADVSHFGNETGLIVEISDLRRKITAGTVRGMKTQLTRRFSLRDSEIQIHLNGEKLDLSPFDVLYQHIKAVNYVGFTDEEMKKQFPEADEVTQYVHTTGSSISAEEIDSLVSEKGIRAWFGVVDKPKRLKEIGLGGVLVYINNKIADENLLASNQSAQMGGQYVTGEIYADYLNDRAEDPITSSRQGLDESDEEVELIMKLAKAMEGKAIAQWDAYKDATASNQLPDQVVKDKKYQKWVQGLSSEQQKLNTRLLRTIESFEDFDDKQWMSDPEKIAFVNSVTTLVESLELVELGKKIDDLGNGGRGLFELITQYLGNIARRDTIQMAEVATKRFNAIERLKALVDKPYELEKAFEDCLFDNPWLLNPFWNRTTKSKKHIEHRRQHFVKLHEGRGAEYKRRFIDIYVEVAEKELPIIVELKRNDGTGHSAPSKVTKGDIIKQIDEYRNAVISGLPTELQLRYEPEDVEAVFIAPEKALKTHSSTGYLSRRNVESLADNKIMVRTYRDLLDDAYNCYSAFFEAQDSFDELPYFRFDLEDSTD
ncbi:MULTISPECIES: ATP-binding protein [Actinomycetaceae]|uniref:ATP-binding protein n=1 Tax=Actinotignum sanguinis TaxID=1445614 RepID=A0ABT5V7W2_9ACTO|nr:MULTISPECIES: ATP-binding protein [Actinotignum]MDE1552496.1 ATP-binding protein [Actinotignum sanguinis]MDE1656916.1 ATP-binding protein [Actinotignum sanguinis]MDK6907282.1 ATP-binding protein [Actinotignum timonense]